MHFASRARKRLTRLYRNLLVQMRQANTHQLFTASRCRHDHWKCTLENLEPRILLSSVQLPVELPMTTPVTVASESATTLDLYEPQMAAATASDIISPEVTQNYQGAYYGDEGYYYPADTMGAVGDSHVVVMLNGQYTVYDKASGNRVQSRSLNSFWINAGVTYSDFTFDPRVVYDRGQNRWYATSVDNKKVGNSIFVAVSDSADPTQGWKAYKFDSDNDDSHWADFPMLGFNGDYVVVSANMFSLYSGNTLTSFLVLDKTDLLNQEESPTYAYHTDYSLDTTGFTPQPVVDYDNGHGALAILSAYNKPSGYLRLSSVDLSGVTTGDFIDVTPRSTQGDIDQPGDKVDIDAGDTRFCSNVVYDNGYLWAVHGVNINDRPSLEWYKIDINNSNVVDSGVIADDTMSYNYPSIAVNNKGNVVIGFSGGSPSTYISSYYVIGTRDYDGSMVFSEPQLITSGASTYERLDTSGRNRWGDYSATLLDTTYDNVFWTFQEYVKSTNIWGVGVTKITLDSAIVGGDFWNDTDHDGVQDFGEQIFTSGYATLYQADGQSTGLSSGINSLGEYSFSIYLKGDYYIEYYLTDGYEFSPQYIGSSLTDSNANPITGRSDIFTVNGAIQDETYDVGVYTNNVVTYASIGDRVWDDVNQNGIQDDSESGLSGMTVNLLNSLGTQLQSTTTDADGSYLFDDLDAGSYIVEFVTSGGYAFVPRNAGNDDTLDSDADTTTGRTSLITVAGGDDITDVDAGMYLPSASTSISGVVWLDEDHDGVRDVGESFMSNWRAYLHTVDGNQIATTSTDSNGAYRFDNLSSGQYYVRFTSAEPSYVYTETNVGDDSTDSDVNIHTSSTDIFTLNQNQTIDHIDAGLLTPPYFFQIYHSEVETEGSQVYVHMNIDDAGLGSHAVIIDWGNDTTDNFNLYGNPTNTTRYHTYTNDGNYQVSVTLTDDTGLSTQETFTIEILNVLPTVDAGGSYSIYEGDTLYLDASGTTDPGSDTLSYAWDLDNDGQFDDATGVSPTIVWSTLSALGLTADGAVYTIGVRVSDDDGFQTGYTTLTINPIATDASINGVAWEDRNDNRLRDEGDVLLANVPVELYDDQYNLIDSTTTDENGAYHFTDLAAGDYKVKFIKYYESSRYFVFPDVNGNANDDLDSDAAFSTGYSHSISLGMSETVDHVDVGYKPVERVTLNVWLDANDNGIFDNGEGAVAGTQMSLDKTDGTYNNQWTFNSTTVGATNLAPGEYVVTVILPEGYSITTPDQGADDSVDSDIDPDTLTFTFTLIEGQTHPAVGAGVLANGQIGDHVWLDENYNGIEDDGESGLAGVTVNLLNTDESLYLTTTTDANGDYLFDHVIEGDYTVQFVSPEAYTFTSQDQGSDDQIDSDVNPLTGKTALFSLALNQQLTDLNAGLYITPALAQINITPQLVDEGSSLSVQGVFNQLFSPNQAHQVTIQWGDGSQDILNYDAGDLNFTQTHSYANDGQYTITVQMSDASDHEDEQTFSVTVANVLPTINLADSFIVTEGLSVQLTAAGTSDPGTETLTYAWDLDNDGQYDDATGISPTITWQTLESLGLSTDGASHVIGLQVTDDHGSVTQASTLTINNALPIVAIGGPYIVYQGYGITLDASGTSDPGSDPLTYEWDLDNDGVFDDALGVTPTLSWEAAGLLGITTLDATYAIALRVTDDTGSVVQTSDITVLPVPAASSISGIAWVDRDLNHYQSEADTTLADVEVQLYDNQNNWLQSTVTDENGAYVFDSLYPGQYAVKFQDMRRDFQYFVINDFNSDVLDSDADDANGWTQTYDVGLLDQVDHVDAGYMPNGIMRFWVWLDENANGTYEIGEGDAAGIVEVEISQVDGDYYTKNKISPNNRYFIKVVNTGEYQVNVLLDDGYELTALLQGDDRYYDSDIDPATLTSILSIIEGQFNPYIGVGILGTGQIGDRVWLDQNADGIEDETEPGVAGVTVNLLYDDGDLCQTTTTDVNGDYLFDHVIDGDYIIEFVNPDDSLFTTQNVGSDDTVDSDADATTGRTSVLTLTGNGQIHNINAGLIGVPVIENVVVATDPVLEGAQMNLSVGITHLDSTQTNTVDIDWGDGHTQSVNLATGVLTTQQLHTYANDGDYDITVTVTDANNQQDHQQATVSVQNVLPTADAGDAYIINEGESVMLDASSTTDPGTDILQYAWDLDNDGQYDDASGVTVTLSWSELVAMGYATDGTQYTLCLQVTDDTGSSTTTTTLMINNIAPNVQPGGHYVLDEGQGMMLDASGTTDDGGDALTYAWDLDNDGVFDDATGVSPTLTWDLIHALGLTSKGQPNTVRLQVTDDHDSAVMSTTITINNLPPIGDAGGSYVIDEGSSVTLDASGSTDPGGDSMVYGWDLDGDMQFDDAVGVSPTISWATLQALGLTTEGTPHTIRMLVFDNSSAMGGDTTTLTINNVLPVADAGDSYQITEGQTLTLDASGSFDVGGDQLSYGWDLDNDGVFDDAVGVSPVIPWQTLVALNLQSDGSANPIALQVTDDCGSSTSQSTLVINNVLPTADAGGAYEITEGWPLFLDASASSDVMGDSLTYTWDLNNDGVFDDVIGSTAELSVQTLNALGVKSDGSANTIAVKVSDDAGSTIAYTTLTINNLLPAVILVGNDGFGYGTYRVNEGENLLLDASDTFDVGYDVLTYEWDLDSDGQFDDATGVTPLINWQTLLDLGFTADNRPYSIRLRVTDDVDSVIRFSTITIDNVLPIADAGGAYVINEGQGVMLDASASFDPGNDTLSYHWDLNENHIGSDAVGVTPYLTWEQLVAMGFSSDGTATTISVSVADGTFFRVASSTLTINNLAPVVDAGEDQVTSETLTVTLQATVDDADDRDTHTCTWDMGDGSEPLVGNVVEYAYADDGQYTVTLTVVDNDGAQATDTMLVTVNNTDPSIDQLAGDSEVFGGFEASFSALASDPAGVHDPLTYTWDFGDGSDPQTGSDLTEVSHTFTQYGSTTVTLTVTDDDGGFTQSMHAILVKRPYVSDQSLFYNNSYYDGNTSTADANDLNAIATDKQALEPGQTGSSVNISTNIQGINGVIVKVLGLTDPTQLTVDDFQFTLGNTSVTEQWEEAPQPTLTLLEKDNVDHPDLFLLTWEDQAITNTWLSVRLLANNNTALAEDHVFYFGNMAGDVNVDRQVSIADIFNIWNNRLTQSSGLPAEIDNLYDVNRDGWVDIVDIFDAWSNRTSATGVWLEMIQPTENQTQVAQLASTPPQTASQLAFALSQNQGRFQTQLVHSDDDRFVLSEVSLADYL